MPLDERLGLPQGKHSYLLQDWDQHLAVEMPYATVSTALTRILGFTQSVHTLERHQRKMATAFGAFWEDRPTSPTESPIALACVAQRGEALGVCLGELRSTRTGGSVVPILRACGDESR